VEDTSATTIKYTTSANSTETAYTRGSTISIPTAAGGGLSWVMFHLYRGSVKVDAERIPIVRDGADGAQGQRAARYLGKSHLTGAVQTVNNIVYGLVAIDVGTTTQQVQAVDGDYFAYLGESGSFNNVNWEKGQLFRFDAGVWKRIETTETGPYMAALADLTSEADVGTFSAVLCRQIMAQQATIDELASHIIKLQAKDGHEGVIYGGERYNANGSDKNVSANGFWLGTDGTLKAAQAFLNNIYITGASVFGGEINIGPLSASNDDIVPPAEKVFAALTRLKDIADWYGATRNVTKNVYAGSGSYGSKTGILSLSIWFGEYLNYSRYIEITIYFNNGSHESITNINYDGTEARTNRELRVGGGVAGKKFRLVNLPQNPANAESGTVYIATLNGVKVPAVI
jgi:hypothetical protein